MTVQSGNNKVTANKSTLNQLSLWAYIAARYYEEKGYHGLAREALEFADASYEALDAAGVYEEVRR